MNDSDTSWLLALNDWAAKIGASVFNSLPSILAAIAILIVGWFVARLVRGLIRRLSQGINRILERVLRTGDLASARLSTPMIAVIAEVAFWVVVLIAITVAVRTAGLTVISGWLNQMVVHLPNLIVGLLIICVGYLASIYIGKLVDAGLNAGAGAGKSAERGVAGRLSQVVVFIAALIIGLDQCGVEVTFLITLLTAVAGTVLVGFSIAFGLGARAHAANLIAARTAQSALQVGLRIRIGETEGNVLELSPSHIVLDTETQRLLVPASMIDEHVVTILTTPEGQTHE